MTISVQSKPTDRDYISVTADELRELSSNRINIHENYPKSNYFAIHPGFKNFPGECILFFNGSGNFIYLDQNCPLRGCISFDGDNSRAYFFGGMPHLNLDVTIYENGNFVWGFNTIAFGVRAWVHGGASLSVGAEGLWSEGIEVRTSDHHSIIDLATGQITNLARDIVVGRRVWVGAGVKLIKGASIGDGSIIGIGSLLTKETGSNELWAGFPAKKIKENVSWLGSFPASVEDIEKLRFGQM